MLRRPIIGLAAFAVILLPYPAAAHTHRASAPADSVGSAPDVWQASSGDRRDRWNLLLGEARTDTLAAPPSSVLSAAVEALEDDDWVIEPYEQSKLAFATDWKMIHNAIFRVFAGGAVARCFVSVAPLETGYSVIRLQGGIASRHDLAQNPMLPFAKHSYRNALRKWALEVRQNLEHRREADAFQAGGP